MLLFDYRLFCMCFVCMYECVLNECFGVNMCLCVFMCTYVRVRVYECFVFCVYMNVSVCVCECV